MKNENHFLETVKWGVIPIVSYKGTHVTKLPSGRYSLWNHHEITPEEVDRYIDESLLAVSKSIKQ